MTNAARVAAQDLRLKQMLERTLRPKLLQYFRRITRGVKLTGQQFDITQHNLELSEILTGHYSETTNIFSRRLNIKATDQERAVMQRAINEWTGRIVPTRVSMINGTTREDIIDAFDAADSDELVQSLFGPERRLTSNVVASRILDRKLNGRATAIMVTETQLPAESAKATEAQVLSGFPPSITQPTRRETGVSKEWVSVGDSVVRDAHITADGQKRDSNEPFIVGGEELNYPGDASLGASAWNIIGCRCSSVYDENEIRDKRK
jgi:hypothetical protein